MTWNDKVGGWLPTCQTYPWQWGLQITPCFIEHRTSVFWTSLGSPWFTKRISQNKCHEGLSVRTLQFWWVFSCHCQPPMNINTYEYVWAKKETLTITKQMLKCPWLKPNVSQRAHCKQHLPMVQASLSLFLTCAFTWEHGPMGNQFNFFSWKLNGNWALLWKITMFQRHMIHFLGISSIPQLCQRTGGYEFWISSSFIVFHIQNQPKSRRSASDRARYEAAWAPWFHRADLAARDPMFQPKSWTLFRNAGFTTVNNIEYNIVTLSFL